MSKAKVYFLFLVVVTAGFFTYFYNYAYPPNLYWDENYHVAGAQKYLNGIYFMELHPPLGKLLIALGEKLLHANAVNDQFISTDHAKVIPPGFSFAGYRFFPALLAWFSCALVFWIFQLLLKNPLSAALLSSLYVFDNAMIVHFRGAMLDGIQMFFMLSCVLLFVILAKSTSRGWRWLFASFVFGCAFGALFVTKVTGLIVLLLIVALSFRLLGDWQKMISFAICSLAGFLLVFVSVWHIHFAIGRNVNPALSKNGYYESSLRVRSLVDSGESASLSNLPVMFLDAWRFSAIHNRGVPKLDLCKQVETGSPYFLWPLGARSINYRWEKQGEFTRYLYLQGNPAVWLCSLIGVLAAGGVLYSVLFMPINRRPANLFFIVTFFGVYVAYMASISMIPRVMYLYHYFIPLMMGILLFALVVHQTERAGAVEVGRSQRKIFLAAISLLVFACFLYFSPLSYYRPLTDKGVSQRDWIGLWDLRCSSCKRTNGFAGLAY